MLFRRFKVVMAVRYLRACDDLVDSEIRFDMPIVIQLRFGKSFL
jgi:hypothetical protein